MLHLILKRGKGVPVTINARNSKSGIVITFDSFETAKLTECASMIADKLSEFSLVKED